MTTPTKQEYEQALKTIDKYYNDVLKKIKCSCSAPKLVIYNGDRRCNTCGGGLPNF